MPEVRLIEAKDVSEKESSYYVFDNLVPASAEHLKRPIAAKAKPEESAKPFSNGNAAGIIQNMSFEQVGRRAAEFAARCKAAMLAEKS